MNNIIHSTYNNIHVIALARATNLAVPQPNSSNLALFYLVWPWKFQFGCLALFWLYGKSVKNTLFWQWIFVILMFFIKKYFYVFCRSKILSWKICFTWKSGIFGSLVKDQNLYIFVAFEYFRIFFRIHKQNC